MSAMLTSYAQNFEDVMLWRALHNVQRGRYIDIGAQHPIVDSISLTFYEHGWRGIHVEPVPAYASLLRSHRPDERVIEAVASDHNGVLSFFEFDGTGLSTANEEIARQYAKLGNASTVADLPCVTLDSILSLTKDAEVHWLKIDVEGFERQVLKGWTVRYCRPWIVVVESIHPITRADCSIDWEPLILEHGYSFVYFDGLNRFYVSNEHSELSLTFSSPPNVFDGFTLAGSASSGFCAQLNHDIRTARDRYHEAAKALVALQQEAERRSLEHRNQLRDSADLLAGAQAQVLMRQTELSAALTHLESRNVELVRARERVESLQQSLESAHLRIEELDRDANEAHKLLEELNHHVRSVYASRSWRITAPLRHLSAYTKKRRIASRSRLSALAELLGRAVRRLMMTLFRYIRARPERKTRLLNLLVRHPDLHRKLRSLAFAYTSERPTLLAGPSEVQPISPGTRVSQTSKAPRWESLSISAQHVHDQLMRARARNANRSSPNLPGSR